MKHIVAFLLLVASARGNAQKSFYDMTVQTLDAELPVNSLYGRTVLVVLFDALAPDSTLLLRLDSLQRNTAGLTVLGFPIGDSALIDTGRLGNLKEGYQLAYPVLKPARLSDTTEEQSPFLEWLTHSGENSHFDRDAEEGMVYAVSPKGTLYAVLGRGAPKEVIDAVATQTFSE